MNDDSRQATLNDLRDWQVFFVSGQMVAVTLPLPEIPLVQLSAKDGDGNPVPVELAAIYASAIAEAWSARAERIYRAFARHAFAEWLDTQ